MGSSSQSYGFSSSHIWIWELDYKESWVLKNWCFFLNIFLIIFCIYNIVLVFELLCWRRLLRVPWTAKRSKQSILKKINPWYWNWSSNSLATWFKDSTHWKRPWCYERLKAGGEGDNRGWDGWMHHRLNGHEFEQTPRGQGLCRVHYCIPGA